jgi:phosphatidylglycerol:prolipoprotein diacylglycerol transferase
MVFPFARPFPADQQWVRDVVEKTGIIATGAMVNLPRHPSQLYEALFEGVFLGLVMWFAVRRKSPFRGFATGAFIAGYGAIRFVIEYFREPDEALGYIIKLGDPDASIHVFSTPFNFSMGQLLCFFMIVIGTGLIAIRWRSEKKGASLMAAAAAERARLEQTKKKLRKKK